ncbi:MAG TPA: ATP-dependent metallopeptidase FtsH/Yme1/Tma family protein, partial [Candidatus Paceibacterota bacterium]
MNNSGLIRGLLVWLAVGLVMMTVFNSYSKRPVNEASIGYSQFLEEVRAGHIAKVLIVGRVIKAETNDDKYFVTYSPGDPGLVSDLIKNGVQFSAKPEEKQSPWMSLLIGWFPMLLLVGVWIFFMKRMQGGAGSGAFTFGKSRAKVIGQNQNS